MLQKNFKKALRGVIASSLTFISGPAFAIDLNLSSPVNSTTIRFIIITYDGTLGSKTFGGKSCRIDAMFNKVVYYG